MSPLIQKIKDFFSEFALGIQRDWRTYRRLLRMLKPYQKRFWVGFACSIPASSLEGLLAFSIAPFLDYILKTRDFGMLMWLPFAIVAICLLQGVFDFISQYMSTYVGNRISMDLQSMLYRQLVGRELSYYKGTSYGDISSRYYSDAHKLQQAIVGNMQNFLIQFFTLLGLAAVLLYRNWTLSIVALGIISLIVIPIAYLSKRLRALDYQLRQVAANMGNLLNETVYGVREIKSYNLYGPQIKRFDKVRDHIFSTEMGTSKKSILLSPIMQLIAGVGIASIVYLGTLYVIHGTMSVGELTSFLVALLLLYKPIKSVASTISKIQVIFAPAERVFSLLDSVSPMQEPENPLRLGEFKHLELENVSFHYGVDKQILKNINLSVTPGDILAIVGTSGGGKTTLIDLISRFIDPSAGMVRMNGIDLRKLALSDIRQCVAMVSQDTMLFNGSIRENILLGRKTATEDELEEALRAAHLTDWVATLPEGIDTPVGDRASFVSGGQKQRIAIARAFLKQAPILILDEATSALDNDSEAQVQAALMDLMRGKTVIMIAHRLSTIRHASHILVMEAGQIVEQGTHEELMALDDLYARLYALQFRTEERKLLQR